MGGESVTVSVFALSYFCYGQFCFNGVCCHGFCCCCSLASLVGMVVVLSIAGRDPECLTGGGGSCSWFYL